MGKTYIWSICLASLLCFSFSGIRQSESSYKDKYSYSEVRNSEYTKGEGFHSSRISSTGNSSGWNRLRQTTRYPAISESTLRFSDNGDTGSQAQAVDTEKRQSSTISVYGGASQEQISKYITYKEATYSPQAKAHNIPNVPNEHHLKAMRNLGVTFFDPLREYFNTPIYINSFFRSKELNTKVGGAIYSDHMCEREVAAIDIGMNGHKGPTNNQIFHYILGNNRFYKLIAEFPAKGKIRWVHVSISLRDEQNGERNVFIAQLIGKRKVYLPYKGNERLISR